MALGVTVLIAAAVTASALQYPASAVTSTSTPSLETALAATMAAYSEGVESVGTARAPERPSVKLVFGVTGDNLTASSSTVETAWREENGKPGALVQPNSSGELGTFVPLKAALKRYDTSILKLWAKKRVAAAVTNAGGSPDTLVDSYCCGYARPVASEIHALANPAVAWYQHRDAYGDPTVTTETTKDGTVVYTSIWERGPKGALVLYARPTGLIYRSAFVAASGWDFDLTVRRSGADVDTPQYPNGTSSSTALLTAHNYYILRGGLVDRVSRVTAEVKDLANGGKMTPAMVQQAAAGPGYEPINKGAKITADLPEDALALFGPLAVELTTTGRSVRQRWLDPKK